MVIVIESYRNDGKKFRPSDWIERLCSTLGTFGQDHRLRFLSDVKPCFIDGEKCLVVEQILQEKNPTAYNYILEFAHANDLRYHQK